MPLHTTRVGVHARNAEQFTDRDYALIKQARIETLKVLSIIDPGVLERLHRDNPDLEFIVRLFDDRLARASRPSPSDFAGRMAPIIQAWQPYASKFEIHSEPNHARGVGGWGAGDDDARSFRDWYGRALEALRATCPWAKFGFPGLALNAPHRDLEWLDICREAIRDSDWLGCHCYWQGENMLSEQWGLRFKLYHERFPDKPIEITEFGNSSPDLPPDEMARQYVQYYTELNRYPYLGSASAFIASSPDPAWARFVWVTEDGTMQPVVQAVGEMPREPAETEPWPEPAPSPTPEQLPAQPPWIFGMHDPGDWRTMFEQAGRLGWVMFQQVVNDKAAERGCDLAEWAGAGYGVLARLVNAPWQRDGRGQGSIPLPESYDNFAERCARFVANSPGCRAWFIGEEMNIIWHWPGRRDTLRPARITPESYADCFARVYRAIKAVQPNALVIPSGLNPLRDPSIEHDDALKWFEAMLAAIPTLDGLDIHTHFPLLAGDEAAAPGPAADYNLAAIRQLLLAAFSSTELGRFCYDRPTFRPVTSEFGSESGLDDMVDELIDYCDKRMLFAELLAEVEQHNPRQYARFRDKLMIPATEAGSPQLNSDSRPPAFYRFDEFLSLVPPDRRSLPVFITGAAPPDRWPTESDGWLQRAYAEVNRWNCTPGRQPVRALLPYRWQGTWPDGRPDPWNLADKPSYRSDLQQALHNDYRWQAESASRPGPPLTRAEAVSRIRISEAEAQAFEWKADALVNPTDTGLTIGFWDRQALQNAGIRQGLEKQGFFGTLRSALSEETADRRLAAMLKTLAPVPIGQAVPTDAAPLPDRHILHAPVRERKGKDEANAPGNVARGMAAALALADRLGDVRSLVLPAVAVPGLDAGPAAPIVLSAVIDYLCQGSRIESITFALSDKRIRQAYGQALADVKAKAAAAKPPPEPPSPSPIPDSDQPLAAFRALLAGGELEQAAARALAIEEESIRAQALAKVADAFAKAGQTERALACYQQALALAQQLDTPREQLDLLSSLGALYHDLKWPKEALACYQQALALAQKLDASREQLELLPSLGAVYRDLDRPEEALACYQQALALAQKLDPPQEHLELLLSLGALNHDLNRAEQALAYYQQAVERLRQLGRADEAKSLETLLAEMGAAGTEPVTPSSAPGLRAGEPHGEEKPPEGITTSLQPEPEVRKPDGEVGPSEAAGPPSTPGTEVEALGPVGVEKPPEPAPVEPSHEPAQEPAFPASAGWLASMKVRVRGTDAVALRSDQDTPAGLLMKVPVDTILAVAEDPIAAQQKLGQEGQWVRVRTADGIEGGAPAWYLALEATHDPQWLPFPQVLDRLTRLLEAGTAAARVQALEPAYAEIQSPVWTDEERAALVELLWQACTAARGYESLRRAAVARLRALDAGHRELLQRVLKDRPRLAKSVEQHLRDADLLPGDGLWLEDLASGAGIKMSLAPQAKPKRRPEAASEQAETLPADQAAIPPSEQLSTPPAEQVPPEQPAATPPPGQETSPREQVQTPVEEQAATPPVEEVPARTPAEGAAPPPEQPRQAPAEGAQAPSIERTRAHPQPLPALSPQTQVTINIAPIPRAAETIDQYTLDIHLTPRADQSQWKHQVILTMRSDNDDLVHFEGPLKLDLARKPLGEAYGRALFDALFHDEAEAGQLSTLLGYHQILGRSARGGALRIQLEINTEDSELHSVKWEYLSGTQAQDLPLGCSPDTPLARVLHVNRPEYHLYRITEQQPLRILAAVASPDELEPTWDQPRDEVLYGLKPIRDVELTALETSLQRVVDRLGPVVEPLSPANVLSSPRDRVSLERLRDALVQAREARRPVHVLHLLCHGVIRPEDGVACLLLQADDSPLAELVTEDDVAKMLQEFVAGRDRDGLRLLVLASCFTAEPTNDRPLMGVARQLVAKGIPAVVAMQGRLEYEAAQHLSQRLYAELVAGGEIDRAVNAARCELYQVRQAGAHDYRAGMVSTNQYGVPVLFTNVPDGRLFEANPDHQQRTRGMTTQSLPLSALPGAPQKLAADALRSAAAQLGLQLDLSVPGIAQALQQALSRAHTAPAAPPREDTALYTQRGQEARRQALIDQAARYRRRPARRAMLFFRGLAREEIAGLVAESRLAELLRVEQAAGQAAPELAAFGDDFRRHVLSAGQVGYGPLVQAGIAGAGQGEQSDLARTSIREWRLRRRSAVMANPAAQPQPRLELSGNLTWAEDPPNALEDTPVPAIADLHDLLYGPAAAAFGTFERLTGEPPRLSQRCASLLLQAVDDHRFVPYHTELGAAVLGWLDLKGHYRYDRGFQGYCLLCTHLLADDDLGFDNLADVSCFLQYLAGLYAAGDRSLVEAHLPAVLADGAGPVCPTLAPVVLRPDCIDSQLIVDESVLQQAIAALNSGKHIILIGPPGTGKTTLAEDLCRCSHDAGCSRGHVLVTATADWTTFDTIGGYAPGPDNQLVFRPGIFLEAIDAHKWLIIDEINRADIDKAFGELFTVLAGQAVTLPYATDHGPVRILPPGYRRGEQTRDYAMDPGWRIIGTMNVYDKASLFAMSLAFMRRFAFIDVTLPDPDDYEALIHHFLAGAELDRSTIAGILKELVHYSAADREREANRLMRWRALGPAMVKDVVEYLEQRGRALGPGAFRDMDEYLEQRGSEQTLTTAHLAEAVLLYIVPQFEGLEQTSILEIYHELCGRFPGAEGDMLRARIKEMFPFVPRQLWAEQDVPRE